MYLTDLATAVRKSGLPVVEVSGWKTRGKGPFVSVSHIVPHHTATPASAYASSNYPALNLVTYGRDLDGDGDIDGPLANLGLGRDGTVYVIAVGYANHAGVVRQANMGNAYTIGIEAEHDGVSPWPVELILAYAKLCKALCDHYGLPYSRVLGHKEVCSPPGRKIDPNFDMNTFRDLIPDADAEDDDMPYTDWPEKDRNALVADVAEAVAKRVLRQADITPNDDEHVSVAKALRENRKAAK
jgi:hypothetical protein